MAYSYKRNPEPSKLYSRERRRQGRRILAEAKNRPCADCGVSYPFYVMDFDHREDKSFTLSKKVSKSRAQLEAEISKCDVVCANCHRERTHSRLGSHLVVDA